MNKFGAQELISVFQAVSSKLDDESAYLCELDGEIGDGDHGTTMSAGFNAIVRACGKAGNSEISLAELFQLAAQSFLDEVGATVGPLYAAAFNNAARKFGDRLEIECIDTLKLFTYLCDGIQTLGKAEVGDKTMIDVWVPVSNAAEAALDTDQSLALTFDTISEISAKAASATRTMIASKGRAARLGERSLGHMDPGAVSASMIIDTVASTLKAQAANQ